jgi:hypothetical protein
MSASHFSALNSVRNGTLSDLVQKSEDSRAAIDLWRQRWRLTHDNITLALVRVAG